MPSLIPVLVHDADVPAPVRTALRAYVASADPGDREAAWRRASSGLRAAFDLSDAEVASLLAVDEAQRPRAC
jgi:hypothetical protein